MGQIANKKRTVRRILKVNHAGEYGAIRIYRAQIFMARKLYSDLMPFLEETIKHEKEHCERFKALLHEREGRPCRTMCLWSGGGYFLGFLSTLLGKQGIMLCTEAVEATVHKHLDEQILFLEGSDQEAKDLIKDIQAQELSHLNYARNNINDRGFLGNLFQSISVILVEIVIWLSTWGDSSRLKSEMATKGATL